MSFLPILFLLLFLKREGLINISSSVVRADQSSRGSSSETMMNGYRESMPIPEQPHVPFSPGPPPVLNTAFPPLNGGLSSTSIVQQKPPLDYAKMAKERSPPNDQRRDAQQRLSSRSNDGASPPKKDQVPLLSQRANSVGTYSVLSEEVSSDSREGKERKVFQRQRSVPLEIEPINEGACHQSSVGPPQIVQNGPPQIVQNGPVTAGVELPMEDSALRIAEGGQRVMEGQAVMKFKTTGNFPNSYAMTMQNGPRYPINHLIPQGPPPGQSVLQQRQMTCFNCGQVGHLGNSCLNKKPMDRDQQGSQSA